MRCAPCGAENLEGKKFCKECGAALTAACGSCGAPLAGDEKFWGECGAVVGDSAATGPPPAVREAPVAERRLVSVLFADLVGFTTLSEARDSEDVRELLAQRAMEDGLVARPRWALGRGVRGVRAGA